MLLFCGDPHGDFDQILRAAERYPRASLILLGDMEPALPLSVELKGVLDRAWWIPGNHDSDTKEIYMHVLGDQSHGIGLRNIDGKVVTLPCGTRIAGLGGVFHKSVWDPGRGGEPETLRFRSRKEHAKRTPTQDRFECGPHFRHHSTIYPATVEFLSKQRVDVLVTHEAPSYHLHGFSLIDELARSMRAKLVVHGHHHDHLDSSARWQEQGFASFGIGLRGVSSIDMNGREVVVAAGAQDSARANRFTGS